MPLVATMAFALTGFIRMPRANASTPVITPTIVDTNYPIPTGALFVSPAGSDANAGTQALPFGTLTHALAVVPVGGTVVMRGGTYRESINSIYRLVTIQAYPHEKPWLDGRQVVTGFTASGTGWVRTGWSSGLCQTCFNPNAILPSAPAAGLPDMVFVDGVAQIQVTTLSALAPATFYVDATARTLTLGSDPTGHVVEATVFGKAMQFSTTGASGSILRGVGVIGYGSYWNTNLNIAMVVASAPNITFENDTFAWSASRGLAVLAAGEVVRGSTFLYNGFQGLVGNSANGLVIDSSTFTYSNQEHFVYGWSSVAGAAGVKIASSTNVTIRDSVFSNNYATGLWFDLSVQGVTVIRNLLQQNLWDGIALELSDTVVVASNVSTDNGALGIKVSGTTNTRVWNNTLANNGTAQIGIDEDKRTNTNTAELALGITWDTANVAVRNNIIASDDGRATLPLVHTLDGNSPKQVGAAQMISSMDTDVYARASSVKPADQDYWATLNLPYYATRYQTLAQFKTATTRETAGTELVNYAASPLFVDETNGNYHLLAATVATNTGAALPADIAATLGIATGTPINRGALTWPGSTPPQNPLLPNPVFGLWNHTTGDRITTSDQTEVNAKVAAGYTYTGISFHAATAPATGLVPVYRLLSVTGHHIYTPWTGERDSLVTKGWVLEATAFYASPKTVTNALQIYRYYDTVTYDHYLSADPIVPVGSRFDANIFFAAS